MPVNNTYPFVNLPLPYKYDALEPYIDEKTMELHHDKHLQTYIDNLNAAIESQPRLKQMPLKQLVAYSATLPEPLRSTIANNAGGVFNHRFFFEQLEPPSDSQPTSGNVEPSGDDNPSNGNKPSNGNNSSDGNKPSGELLDAINKSFGSFDKFKTDFKAAALSVFGSGYAWLVSDGKGLRIVTTENQGLPLNDCLLLNADVWEHAYYLKHNNVRAEYLDNLFNVIDWKTVERRYQKCRRKF